MTARDVRAQLAGALGDLYQIEEEVGRGGMATVFRACDLKHDRDVALKVLRPEVAIVGGRFKREIRLAAGLRHPHILPVYDSGEVDDLLYYVMPLITGQSLLARLRTDGCLPLEDTLAIAPAVGSNAS